MTESERLIRALRLLPHPEGGHYRETFRDSAGLAGRAHSTAIYFLLTADEVSHWHRIDAAEMWHYYRGAPLQLDIAQDGGVQRFILGPRIEEGEQPQSSCHRAPGNRRARWVIIHLSAAALRRDLSFRRLNSPRKIFRRVE